MKAAVLHQVNQPLVIEDVSVPNPGPREVLIRTRVAGLCHSDLHFMEGLYPHPLPAVLGHESAGVVEKVGSDVTYVKPGDHVVTCLSVFCGTCDNCTTGRTVHLMSGIRIDQDSATSAHGTSYVTVYTTPAGDGPHDVTGFAAIGEYHDEFRKTAEGWQIARRTLVVRLRDASVPPPSAAR